MTAMAPPIVPTRTARALRRARANRKERPVQPTPSVAPASAEDLLGGAPANSPPEARFSAISVLTVPGNGATQALFQSDLGVPICFGPCFIDFGEAFLFHGAVCDRSKASPERGIDLSQATRKQPSKSNPATRP
jgi:hypothetical protein